METTHINKFFRQDPQSNLSIQIEEGVFEVTFQVLDVDNQEIEGYKGKVSFDNSWACEYVGMEVYPYSESKELCSSELFLWKLTRSGWFEEKVNQRSKIYPTWLDWDKRVYLHYLILGHYNCIQIIASGFKIDLIPEI